MKTSNTKDTAENKVAVAKAMGRNYAKTILKAIDKNGFVSYQQTTREVEAYEKRTNICAYQIRGVIIALKEAGVIDITLPVKVTGTKSKTGVKTKVVGRKTTTKNTKPKTKMVKEVVTSDEARKKFNVVNLRERHDKMMEAEGYTKVKSTGFPAKVTYERTVEVPVK